MQIVRYLVRSSLAKNKCTSARVRKAKKRSLMAKRRPHERLIGNSSKKRSVSPAEAAETSGSEALRKRL